MYYIVFDVNLPKFIVLSYFRSAWRDLCSVRWRHNNPQRGDLMQATQLPILQTQRLAYKMRLRHGGGLANRSDLQAEAVAAAVSSAQRFDPARGTAPLTFAYAAMLGRVRDVLAREKHQQTCRQLLAQSAPSAVAMPSVNTAQLAVRKAIIAVSAQMMTDERLLLTQVYGRDRSIADVARCARRENTQLERAHGHLLRRLRAKLLDYA